MQCVLREKLLAHGIKLTQVSNIYLKDSSRFVEAYFIWLEETEKDLAGLRSPISILLQSEKSLLLSVLDGYLPSCVQEGKSLRKCQKAAAAQSLEKISKVIYSKIEQIDQDFDKLSENLCHAVAVLATKEPEVYKKIKANQQGVDMVFKMLGETLETIPMYNYFCAKLASSDINYLLMDILQRIVSNKVDIPN